MVQALGAPSDVVQAFAAQDALDGVTPVLSTPATTMTTTAAMTPASVTTPSTAPNTVGPVAAAATTGPLYNRTCYGHHFDSNKGSFYACFNQFIAHEYSGGDWYMADHFYSSGTMHDPGTWNPDELTGLDQGVHYGGGNAMIQWNPKTTTPGGNCSTRTVTVGAFGQSYSDSFETCPEQWGLQYISQWTFHTKWDGRGNGPSYGSRDTGGVDEVHSPAGASALRSTFLEYWFE